MLRSLFAHIYALLRTLWQRPWSKSSQIESTLDSQHPETEESAEFIARLVSEKTVRQLRRILLVEEKKLLVLKRVEGKIDLLRQDSFSLRDMRSTEAAIEIRESDSLNNAPIDNHRSSEEDWLYVIEANS